MQQFQVGLRDPPGAGAEQAGLQLGAALGPSTVRGHQLAPACTLHTALRVSTFAALLFVLQEEEENPQPGGDARERLHGRGVSRAGGDRCREFSSSVWQGNDVH